VPEPFSIVRVKRDSDATIDIIAKRMGLTLAEVIGEAEGKAMYTPEWLVARVRWHLDPDTCTGAVFAAMLEGSVLGHTIVRVEQDEKGGPMGLFSTSYVDPAARRRGIADALLNVGEDWMREQGMPVAATHTAATNAPLIALYEKHAYRIVLEVPEKKMIRLAKSLDPEH